MMTMRERVYDLQARHGSLRAAAEAVGVDHAYLLRLRTGEKIHPSKAVLKKLGMRPAVFYYYVNGK